MTTTLAAWNVLAANLAVPIQCTSPEVSTAFFFPHSLYPFSYSPNLIQPIQLSSQPNLSFFLPADNLLTTIPFSFTLRNHKHAVVENSKISSNMGMEGWQQWHFSISVSKEIGVKAWVYFERNRVFDWNVVVIRLHDLSEQSVLFQMLRRDQMQLVISLSRHEGLLEECLHFLQRDFLQNCQHLLL